MKITIITYLEKEDAKEHDVVVDQVAEALKARKHTPSILGVHGDVRKLISGLSRRKPELVFNLMEMFGTNVRADVPIAGLLDLLGYAYTGGGPSELALRQDKGLAKRALAFEKILYPTSPSSPATTWRPAATSGCPCSSSRSGPTPRSGSAPTRWSATPPP